MGRERGVLPKYRARGVKPAAAWMALTLLGACGGEGANGPAVEPRAGTPVATADPPAQAARPAPPPPRDDGRLPPTATPERYSISLRIDPDQLRFSGVASIQVSLPETTWHVVLNARDIHVTRAVARFSATAGGPLAEEVAATAEPRLAHGGVVPEELVLSLARPLPAGEAVLEIAYDAPFAPDLAGLYRVEENGRSYAYTQFEATDARRAFPCFDEPSFKTVYDVTIAAPRGLMVVANSPETSHEDAPDGAVVHKFETTRPLPSYLVAFAVGAFDVAQGQTDPFPIRVITTKGRAGLSQLALDAAAGLIAKLGDYFGVPYPYPKLDLVAVPDFSAGAMENPGLVTFRDVLILLDPKRATTALRRDQATVIAHEFAHQWFGDLVTMQWWDDVWLNEGFATWAEARIVDLWKPSFGAELDQIRGLSRVMDEDALRTARAVREPVHSTSEAEEAFDEITYEKGAAVLRMLERYLGADTFRRGLQQYIRANAWKNARADDLFAALDFVSAQHVGPLATSFLDHPGVPNVRADLRCTKGAAKLALAETEWRPLGESAGDARTWMLPVCIAADGLRGGSCFTLGPGGIERDLGAACPSWLYPNADQAGYYRYAIDRVQLLALARGASALPPLDRFGLVANAWAQVRAGTLDASTVLDMLPLLDRENDRNVLDQIVGTLEGVDAALVVDGDRAAFRKYVAARLGPRARALGWTAAPHEDDDRALARHTLLSAMGELAEDDATLRDAEKWAKKWLADTASVPADVASVAVPLASERAGQLRLDELRAAARSASLPDDRVLAIKAMGSFDDPAVLRTALGLALGDELKLSELRYLFEAVLERRVGVPVLYAWEKEHWAQLRARLPGAFGHAQLVSVAGALCTAAERDDARAFFGPATQGIEGTARPLEQALEAASLCVALREHGSGDVARVLRTTAPAK
jgi:alanyl aminopeptidase